MSILEIVLYSIIGVAFIIYTTILITKNIKKRKNPKKDDVEDD